MGNDLYPLRYKIYKNSLNLTPNRAALKIQRVWRKYIVKRNMENVRRRFYSWFWMY